jgi:hypothetical protein
MLGVADVSPTALELAADFVVALALSPGLSQGHHLSAAFTVDLAFQEIYTGPGSGLVIGGVTQDQNVVTLKEGDTFRVTLPWAGVQGRSGTARVLSRTIDGSGLLTFVLFFAPTVDPSIMQSQADSGRPRLVVVTAANLPRRMKDAEKTLARVTAKE